MTSDANYADGESILYTDTTALPAEAGYANGESIAYSKYAAAGLPIPIAMYNYRRRRA